MTGTEELRGNWRLLLACVVGLLFGTPFLPYLLSPLVAVFSKEFGWTLPDVVRLMPYQAAGMTLGLPLAGFLADRIAPRPLILTTMAILAALTICVPFAAGEGYATLCALFFVLGFLAAGLSGLYYTRVVGAVFQSARGFALGATLAGAGFAGFAAPLYAQAMVGRFGLEWVYQGAGLLMVLVAMPLVFLGLSKAPHPRGAHPKASSGPGVSLAEAARDPRLYLMLVPPLAFGLVASSLIVVIVPALRERGVDAGTAAVVASLYGVATVVGRLGGGWLLDRFRPALVGVGVFATAAICTLAFQSELALGAVVAVIAVGLVNGAEIDIMSFMTVRYFGIGHYGRIFGVAYAVFLGASMVGPFFAGGLMQQGGAGSLFLTTSVLLAFSSMALLVLARIEGRPLAGAAARPANP